MNTPTYHWRLLTFLMLTLSPYAYADDQPGKPADKAVFIENIDVGGRLQLDAAHFLNDEQHTFSDQQRIRRARLTTKIDFVADWSFELDYDFARDDRSAIRDLLLQHQHNSLTFSAGQFKEPFSMERITSRRDLGFMERSLVSALSPSRSLGFAVQQISAKHTLSVGIFDASIEDYHDKLVGLSSRLTYAAQAKPGFINHLGTSLSYRKPANNTDIGYRQRIETRNTDIRLVDTGKLFADNYLLTGFEAAVARDTLALKAEWVRSAVNDAQQSPEQPKTDLAFSGWHIDFAWNITGEKQTYNQQKGTLGRLIPTSPVTQGGIGGWRFSARLSQLDLNDSFIRGGKQRNLTANLTWVLNRHINVMAEYVKVLSIKNTQDEQLKPDFIQARLELAF